MRGRRSVLNHSPQDTAGCLATCTGGPHFEGYVDVFMEAVQRISAETDDPDIAVAAYSFYGWVF